MRRGLGRGAYPGLAIAGVLALFAAVNALASQTLAGLRIDATQDRLFTLADATRDVLRGLKEPVTLEFHVTRAAAASEPAARAYAGRIADTLRVYADASGGKVRLASRDPAPYSETEDAALAAGLQSASVGADGTRRLYLGLIARAADGRSATVPFFAPEREGQLEYDITRAIVQATTDATPRAAVITSLPWLFAPEDGRPVARIARGLSDGLRLDVLAQDFDSISPEAGLLIIAQPWALTPWQLYLVDQFAMRRGRILLFADPASSTAGDGGGGEPAFADALGPLPALWGFAISASVVMDRARALDVQTEAEGRPAILPQPLYFAVPRDGMSASSPVTSGLSRAVHVGSPGEIMVAPGSGLAGEPLLRTTQDTMRIDAGRAVRTPAPDSILRGWQSETTSRVIAARFTGRLRSAFPVAPPEPAPRSPEMAALIGPRPAVPPPLAASAAQAEIIVVADSDLLNDGFHMAGDAEAADNSAFVLNAADVLAGTQSLVGLRSRAPAARPLTVVETMRGDARARVAAEEDRLASQVSAAEQRLATLEGRAGEVRAGRAAAAQREIERLRADVVEARRRLRQVQNQLRVGEDRLKLSILAGTGVAIPALALIVCVWIAARARRGAGRPA